MSALSNAAASCASKAGSGPPSIAVVGNTMQLLYLIHGEDVYDALWHVPCLNSSVLPLPVCLYAPSVAIHLYSLFFGLDVTDLLGSVEGCDGRAVVKVSPIARQFFPLQHGHLDSHESTFLFCIFFPLVGSFIVYNDVHLEL